MEKEVKNILIAGGSGLIGKRIAALLESKSFNVYHLTRNPDLKGNYFFWDPEKKQIDKNAIENADVIVNLAGTSLANQRWTAMRKRQIVNSRMFSTNFLFESLQSIPNHVKLVINASAIGIYGNSGVLFMNENSPVANDFLGKTCQRWEQASHQFEKINIRTVIFRMGQVLSEEGGMLPELIKSLRYGIMPVFASGNQYQSWIHIDDVCKMISKAIVDDSISGVYNAVAPGPLSNRNFMLLLTQILDKKYFEIRIPAIFMKLMLGEMSIVVINGTRASCKKIEAAGFVFKYPQADMALRNLLQI